MVNEPNVFWVQVMKGKYQKIVNAAERIVDRRAFDSYLWKNLQPLWLCLLSNMDTSLRDGSSTLFWMDCWLGDGSTLSEWCPVNS